jgi:hypothetical protein
MIFVRQTPTAVQVRLASIVKGKKGDISYLDGGRDFAPEEMLFGRHAAALSEGVYTNAGEYVGTAAAST